MQILNKKNLTRAFYALVTTLALAAVFHLLLVAVVALAKRYMSYLNPLDFLGISILFPDYRYSMVASGIGWFVLAILFFTILYIRIHYHLYVAIIRESTNKITKTTKELRKKVLEKIS